MVASILDEHIREIADLCRRYKVRRLEVFGSAADGTFNPERSDLDFLVEYESLQPGEYADAYFGLLEDLGRLFSRKIDLVTPGGLRNPYFVRRVNESRKLIYDSRS